jgi:TM2 domain-containing membrane protein YozV
MRTFIALSSALAAAAPGGGVLPAPSDATSGRRTAEITVLAPEYSGAFLSLVLPGMGQFYAGNPIRGAIWLGLAAAVGATTYSVLDGLRSPTERQVNPGSTALIGAIAFGAVVGVGVVSTVDALADIGARYAASQAALVAPEGKASVPRPAAGGKKRTDDE